MKEKTWDVTNKSKQSKSFSAKQTGVSTLTWTHFSGAEADIHRSFLQNRLGIARPILDLHSNTVGGNRIELQKSNFFW